jgi:hypothetical protein
MVFYAFYLFSRAFGRTIPLSAIALLKKVLCYRLRLKKITLKTGYKFLCGKGLAIFFIGAEREIMHFRHQH